VLLFGQRRLQQQLQHAQHASHRRANLVADIGHEAALEMGQAQRFVAGAHDLALGLLALQDARVAVGDGAQRGDLLRLPDAHAISVLQANEAFDARLAVDGQNEDAGDPLRQEECLDVGG